MGLERKSSPALCVLACLLTMSIGGAASAGENTCGPDGGKHMPLLCSNRTALPTEPMDGGGGKGDTQPYRYLPGFQYKSSDFDIPVEVNDAVWEHLEYMQRSLGHLKTVLERGAYYIPMMRRALFDAGCPQDLVYLSMIESNYSPTARSIVDAAGMWQFMESTAKKYNLVVNEWVDERLDVEKSTYAAGLFLLDLYDRFGDWPLALAAYNAGPGAVSKAIKNCGTRDFWKIAETKALRPETKGFVPKFYAALLVGKFPARFGINNIKQPADNDYVNLVVPPLTGLYTVASLARVPYEELLNMNAQYLYECTPPFEGRWTIRIPARVPVETREKIAALDPELRNMFLKHRVVRGESVSRIARQYKVPISVVLEANGLKSYRDLRSGMVLVVPVRRGNAVPKIPHEPSLLQEDGKYKVIYTVGDGDTLWKIANSAGVTVEEICQWNGIDRGDVIHPGDRLVIYCASRGAAYRASKEGDSNHRENIFGTPPSQRVVFHTVKAGESLSRIARRYRVSVQDITKWNDIPDANSIRPGQRIKIYR